MGNQTSASGSGGPGDVSKLYTIEGETLDAGETYGGFLLLRGRRKRDDAPVLVFRCEKSKTTSAGLCSNALRQAKRLRHPLILNLLDGVETDTDVLMVTEEAMPLALCLSEVKNESQRAWGIRCLGNVLAFLNEKCNLVHGNVTPWSVFVTPGGDWKLFGLELLDMDAAGQGGNVNLPQLLRQAQWLPNAQYKSPERRKNDFKAMENSNLWSIDSWGLGCVILDTYECRVQSSNQARADPVADCVRLLPSGFASIAKQLLHPDPRTRLAPSAFLRSDYFSHMFVKSMIFLEELQLKAPEKREGFFKSLAGSAPSFPPGALQYKVLPLIAQAISFEARAVNAANVAAASGQPPPSPANVNILINMLDAMLVCDQTVETSLAGLTGSGKKTVTAHIDAAITDMFGCNDRIVRVGLLQRMDRIAACTSADSLNKCFDQICTGFADATLVVRELTIKAMIPLVPKLSDQNKNDKLVRFLATLQNDREHAIRTNCVVCLGLIAPQLSADARRKTLTASFARALKDPFVYARAAGLRGLISAHKLMGLEADTLATKILPTVCPLLVDPSKEVRTLAVEAMSALMKTLQENLKTAEASAPPSINNQGSTDASVGTQSAEKSSDGFFGMALSLASSLTTAKPVVPTSASTTAPIASRPQHSVSAAAPNQSSIQVSKSKSTGAKWDEDESPGFIQDEEDPDDFFLTSNMKKPPSQSSTTLAASNAPVKDIFSAEDATKLKPARIGRKKTDESKAPTARDLLTDDDMNFFSNPVGGIPRNPHSPSPKLGMGGKPAQSKVTPPADDADFFASLLSGPPKKKS